MPGGQRAAVDVELGALDLAQRLVAGGVAKRIGLPQPLELERGPSEITGRVLLGGAGRVAEAAARVLAEMGVDAATALDDPVRSLAAAGGLDAAVFNPEAPADQRFKALVFDATGAELVELHRFFHPTVRRVLPSGSATKAIQISPESSRCTRCGPVSSGAPRPVISSKAACTSSTR